MTMHLRGRVSWFGGPEDMGVSPDEGLAFIYSVDDAPDLFLPEQPPGTTGLARRLDPAEYYIACRWDYDVYPKPSLLENVALVRAPKTGKSFLARPADWGPHEDTGRVADISKGLMDALGIQTDDEIEVVYPFVEQQEDEAMYGRIVMSSGHGLYVRGASGIIDEVDEARRVVDTLADMLSKRGVDVKVFHDNTSHSQNENLETIVDYHNAQIRDLDISVHFNAYEQVEKPMGTEVLYVTQPDLAAEVSAAIAACGLIDRGAKHRSDLYFLNNTEMPAILIEVCFVDSEADCEIYADKFAEICDAIATVLSGDAQDRPDRPDRPPRPQPVPQVHIETSGPVMIFVNGEQVA